MRLLELLFAVLLRRSILLTTPSSFLVSFFPLWMLEASLFPVDVIEETEGKISVRTRFESTMKQG
jgi:hypothetical protein